MWIIEFRTKLLIICVVCLSRHYDGCAIERPCRLLRRTLMIKKKWIIVAATFMRSTLNIKWWARKTRRFWSTLLLYYWEPRVTFKFKTLSRQLKHCAPGGISDEIFDQRFMTFFKTKRDSWLLLSVRHWPQLLLRGIHAWGYINI